MRQLEPGHHTLAAPSAPPPRREARNKLKTPAAFRVTARGPQLRRPRPGAVGDLDPDDAIPGPDRDRDRFPGSSRAAVPDTVTEDLAHQQDSHISARVPRAEYLGDENAGGPRPLRPPGKCHALPDRHPGHHRTRPSPAAPSRETSRAAGGRRDMHAHLNRERQAARRAAPANLVRGSSVDAAPVRGRPCKADGSPHRSQPPIPVRYASVDTATQRPTAPQGDTRRDKAETPR